MTVSMSKKCGTAALLAALLLAGCGQLPGVEVRESPAASSATVSEADLEATIQARLEATANAKSPSAEASTEASDDAEASTEASDDAEASAEASADAEASAEASDEAEASADAEASAEASDEASASPKASTPAQASGATASSGDGVVVAVGMNANASALTGDSWTKADVEFDDENCGSTAFAFFDDQGKAWFSCVNEAYTSEDGTNWSESTVDEITYSAFPIVGQDHRIYGTSLDDFYRYSNGELEVIGKPEDFGGDSLPTITDGVFMSDGTGMVLASQGGGYFFFKYNGSGWEKLGSVTDFGLEENNSVSEMFVTSKGDILLGGYAEIRKLEGNKFEPVVSQEEFGKALGRDSRVIADVNRYAETPDGRIWVATEEGLFVWDGSKLDVYDRTNGLPSKNVLDVAVDEAGKVWVATQSGVAMLNGDTWEVALPSTSDLSDSYIQRIAVKGSPVLPAADSEPKTTTISGRVTEDGKAVANTEVELCSELPGGYNKRNDGDTPCANQLYTQTVKTDDKGNFTFENVPIGTYTATFFSTKENNWVWFVNLDINALEADSEVVQDIAVK